MKKRIIAVVCAAMLVLGSSMTAFATPSPEAGVITPSPEAPAITPGTSTDDSSSSDSSSTTTTTAPAVAVAPLVAPRLDLIIESEDVAIAPLAVSQNTVKIGNVSNAFKDSVLEALEICIGTDIRVLNVLDCKNLVNAETPIALSAPGVTTANNIIVLAYNDALGVWQFLPVAALDGEIYTVLGGHSKMAIIVDGALAKALRFAADSTSEEVMEYLAENGTVQTVEFLNGGKDMTTAMEVSSDALVAPATGDAQMVVVVLAAAAFAVAFAVSGKKLVACN